MCKACDPNKLYTCMVVDVDVPSGGYFHYLVVNARGCDRTTGVDAFDYFFSFALSLSGATIPLTVDNPAPEGFFHRHVHQCYEQARELQPTEYPTASGCTNIDDRGSVSIIRRHRVRI